MSATPEDPREPTDPGTQPLPSDPTSGPEWSSPSTHGDATQPEYLDPTLSSGPPPATPPGPPPAVAPPPATSPESFPSQSPPANPYTSNPYISASPSGTGSVPSQYAAGPRPPVSGGVGQPLGTSPNQQVLGSGGPNTSALIATIISGLSLVCCNFYGLVPLILGIVSLTKSNTEPEASAKWAKYAWIAFAVSILLYIVSWALLIVGLGAIPLDPADSGDLDFD